MATWDRETHYYSGQGVVLVGEYGTTDLTKNDVTGLTAVGNVTDLRISIETSSAEHKESQSGMRLVDYQFPTETKASLIMTVENFSRDILAMAFRGSYTAKTGTTIAKGSALDIKFYKGKVVPLQHIKVSAVTIDKGETPLVPYNPLTPNAKYDYVLNEEAGSVRFSDDPDTVSLDDGDALKVYYTYADHAVVDALTSNPAPRFLRFEGLNTVDGDSPVVVEAFKFVLDPAKELALITSEEMASFEMEGALLADSNQITGSKIFRQLIVR
ncbi:MAG: hypothetical protein RBR42_05075 [Desulfomicrobium sp.]|nr:hypothetical protein [Desulfomicrobium sp.]